MADGGSATQAWRQEDIDAVQRLLACDVDDLTGPELGEWLVAWSRLSGRLEARAAAVAARWDSRQVWAGDAARSGAGWLAARTEWKRSQAADVVTFGRRLRELPVVSDAVGSGRIGAAKARLLVRAAQAFPERFADHAAFLVDQIAPLTADAARVAVAAWMHHADQEASSRPDPDADDAPDAGDDPGRDDAAADEVVAASDGPVGDAGGAPEERSRYTMAHTVGGWLAKATFDTATGAVIDEAVAAELDVMYRAGIARPEDGWTLSERKALALAELVRRGSLPSTRHGSPRPLVVGVVDLRLLADPRCPGTGPGLGVGPHAGTSTVKATRNGPGTGTTGGRLPEVGRLGVRCEIVGAGPIAVETMRRLACDGDLVRVVVGADSQVLDVGRAARLATPAQRRALLVRDGGCIAPGCTAPPEHCEAHHIVEYDQGGGTDLANLALLCRFHHHRYHEGGHRIRRRPDGTLEFRRPDGSLHATAPPGHKLPTTTVASQPPLPVAPSVAATGSEPASRPLPTRDDGAARRSPPPAAWDEDEDRLARLYRFEALRRRLRRDALAETQAPGTRRTA